MKALLHFDGACRGNPGGLSAGAAVLTVQIPEIRQPIQVGPQREIVGVNVQRAATEKITVHGPVFHGTNNEAEWQGLLAGLHEAAILGVQDLEIYGDSKLVIMQVTNQWRVKTPHLQPLHAEARTLLQTFKRWSATWIPREENSEADRASNEAIDNPRKHRP